MNGDVVGLEVVLQGILDQGQREAQAIVEAARKEREQVLGRARAEVAAVVAQREREAKEAVERRRVQDLARAELEAKRTVLNGQKELLDQVNRSALDTLRTLADREALLGALLAGHAADWRAGRVYCNEEDHNAVRRVVGAAYGGTIDCAGGVVIESNDGRRRIDLRFEVILQDVWDDAVKEVAQALWPQG